MFVLAYCFAIIIFAFILCNVNFSMHGIAGLGTVLCWQKYEVLQQNTLDSLT